MLFSCGKKTQETKPIKKDVTETVFASGTLEADGSYNLTAQADGYLLQVYFKEGDLVTEGSVLAIINNQESVFNEASANAVYEISKSNTNSSAPSLVQSKNSYKVAREKMILDSINQNRYKRLLDLNSVSKADYENSVLQYQTSKSNYDNAKENYNQIKQQAEQQLIINKAQMEVNSVMADNNQIKALSNGKVYKKLKQKGDFVRKGEVIATIGDANFLYAKVSIDESSISQVKVGQESVIQLNINKQKNYKGKVAEILPAFNEQTQSFVCKINFIEPLDFKVINTQLQVNIITGTSKNALLIPRNYLQYGNMVSVKGEKDPTKISTKFISSEWVQVISGIDENTIIITDKIK
jgi:multidrug efflux pump subunit AcrA (membrane-fusion protein)